MSPLSVWLSEQAPAIAETEPAPGKNALAWKNASKKRRELPFAGLSRRTGDGAACRSIDHASISSLLAA
jgi:hypothetical protein